MNSDDPARETLEAMLEEIKGIEEQQKEAVIRLFLDALQPARREEWRSDVPALPEAEP